MMSMDGEGLRRALEEGRLRRPLVVTGLVKQAEEEQEAILFSPGRVFPSIWIPIPAALIERADIDGKFTCEGQSYDVVTLTFKEPEQDEAAVFAEVLRSVLGRTEITPAPSPGITPFGAVDPQARPQLSPLTQPLNYNPGICEIYMDGQLYQQPQIVHGPLSCEANCERLRKTYPYHTWRCVFSPIA